jgi:hypothetical protein
VRDERREGRKEREREKFIDGRHGEQMDRSGGGGNTRDV